MSKKSRKEKRKARGKEAVRVASDMLQRKDRLTMSVPLSLAATGKPREYRGELTVAGRIRDDADEPGDTYVEAAAIKTAIDSGAFDGLACFVDHANWFNGSSMRNLFGAWYDVEWDEETQAAVGTLRHYANSETDPIADRLDQMLADAGDGIPVPDTGVSLHFYPIWGVRDNYDEPRRLVGFKKIKSADLVFTPAADSRILEALSALRPQQQEEPAELAGGKDGVMKLTSEEVSAILAGYGSRLTADDVEALSAGEYENEAALGSAIRAALDVQTDGADSMAAVLSAINGIGTRLDGMETAVSGLVEEETIEGMGASPRRQPDITMIEKKEELAGHVDWFFGVEDAPAPPSNYRNLSQLYIALTGDTEFYGQYNEELVKFAGANSTDLPNMAVNAMNKVMTAQFSALTFWRWFERVVDVVANDGSLHDMSFITLGGIDNLPTVAEKGDYTELDMGDAKETAAFLKKGGYVGITLEMFRNSSIGQVQAVPRALAIAAIRTRSAAVSALFTSNAGLGPTLAQDAVALFNAAHTNLATTAFSETAWRAARSECFKHAELESGKALGIFPGFALVAADNYDLALSTFGYGEGMPTTYSPEAQARGLHDPRPIPLAVPDWTDANDWGYVTDPKVHPVIQMSYAQSPGGGNHPAPELFTVSSPTSGLMFTNDTLPIKVRDQFALGVNGWRGIGKRNVA